MPCNAHGDDTVPVSHLSNVECGSKGSIFTARLSWLLSGTRQVKTLIWMKKEEKKKIKDLKQTPHFRKNTGTKI